MKNSIYRRIRSRMIHTLIIAVMVLMIIMAAGLLITRYNLKSIINTHSDSVARDAGQALVAQTEDILHRFTQNQSALIDEQMAIIISYVEQMSYIATLALSASSNYRNTLSEITEIVLASIIGSAADDFRIACYYGTEQGDFFIPRNYEGDHPPAEFDPRTRLWYTKTKEQNALTWTEINEDAMGRGFVITCAKPFYDGNGNIAGVAGAGVIINNLKKIIGSTNIEQLSRAFILNDSGRVIISEQAQLKQRAEIDIYGITPGKNLLEDSNETLQNAVSRIIGNETGIERAVINGREVFFAFHSLKSISWDYVIIADVNEITAAARQIEANMISSMNSAVEATDFTVLVLAFIELIVVMIAILYIFYFSGHLAKNITKKKKMVKWARTMGANGE